MLVFHTGRWSAYRGLGVDYCASVHTGRWSAYRGFGGWTIVLVFTLGGGLLTGVLGVDYRCSSSGANYKFHWSPNFYRGI